jgi:hypothetical protein
MIQFAYVMILQYQHYRNEPSGMERMLIGGLSAAFFYLIAAAFRGAKKQIKGRDFENTDKK